MNNDFDELRILPVLYDPSSIREDAEMWRNLARSEPDPFEPQLISYLKDGLMLFLVTLAVFDTLGTEEKEAASASVLTDGVWCWRSHLPYFVSTYHFRLPDQFIEHARANHWRVPEIGYLEEKELSAQYIRLKLP